MKKSSVFCLIVVLISCITTAQTEINNYKYIVVPDQFDFVKGKDKYQLNSLTKFLFNKYGYTAFLESDEAPKDYKLNKCLALEADVKKIKKGFLDTRIQIDLINCDDQVVHSSKVGITRIKEYAKAYNVALRGAFETYQNLDYAYTPDATILERSVSNNTVSGENAQSKIDELQKEIEALKKESVIKKEKQKDNSSNNPTESTLEISKEEIEQPKVEKAQDSFNIAPEEESSNWFDGLPKYSRKGEYYYLKPGFGGTYLMDTNNKEVLKLQYTSDSSVFIVAVGNYTGVAFMKNKDIKVEYYLENGDKRELYYDAAQ